VLGTESVDLEETFGGGGVSHASMVREPSRLVKKVGDNFRALLSQGRGVFCVGV
jgi:hypothetical protein